MPQNRQQLALQRVHLGVHVFAAAATVRNAAAGATGRRRRHEYSRKAQVAMREP